MVTLTTFIGCSKDSPIAGHTIDECGTITDMTWTQNVTSNNLYGNWTIWNIHYKKGSGNSTVFDTTYGLNASLFLDSNGTGTIYSLPINWALTIDPNNFPLLSISQADTLFPFQVDFIQSGEIEIFLQSQPNQRFYGRVSNIGSTWEYADISIKR